MEFNLSNLEACVERRGFEATGGVPSASIEDHDFENETEQQLHRCCTIIWFLNS